MFNYFYIFVKLLFFIIFVMLMLHFIFLIKETILSFYFISLEIILLFHKIHTYNLKLFLKNCLKFWFIFWISLEEIFRRNNLYIKTHKNQVHLIYFFLFLHHLIKCILFQIFLQLKAYFIIFSDILLLIGLNHLWLWMYI